MFPTRVLHDKQELNCHCPNIYLSTGLLFTGESRNRWQDRRWEIINNSGVVPIGRFHRGQNRD